MPIQQQVPQQQQITFPCFPIMVGQNGIVIETYFSPTISIRCGLAEEQVNEMLKVWVQNRKQLQAQQQLVHDVMRNKLH